MAIRTKDLHGNAPDEASIALLLIDVINDLEFKEGKEVLKHALPMAKKIAALKKRAKRDGIPVVYVNDNFGKWRSDFNTIVNRCLEQNVCGKSMVELLRPDKDDYFVLKPKISGFYSTPLGILLKHLGVHTLILAGMSGNMCVLSTASDAYMRDFKLLIPSDCIVSVDHRQNKQALAVMQTAFKADIRPSDEISFSRI